MLGYPHFTAEETEAQRGEVSHSGSQREELTFKTYLMPNPCSLPLHILSHRPECMLFGNQFHLLCIAILSHPVSETLNWDSVCAHFLKQVLKLNSLTMPDLPGNNT